MRDISNLRQPMNKIVDLSNSHLKLIKFSHIEGLEINLNFLMKFNNKKTPLFKRERGETDAKIEKK